MRKSWACLAAVPALLAWSMVVPEPGFASSHREAPSISIDPSADNTDVYAFVSPEPGREDRVVLISNFIPLQKKESGPNFWRFDDNCLYDIRVDNTGDGREDIIFRFKFNTSVRSDQTFLFNTGAVRFTNDRNLNVSQDYSVTMIRNGAATVLGQGALTCPPFVGTTSMPNYSDLRTASIHTMRVAGDDFRVFAGHRAEQFYLDLGAVFDLLQINTVNSRPAINGTADVNVHSVALEIPMSWLTKDRKAPTAATGIIGVYSCVLRQQNTFFNGQATASSNSRAALLARQVSPPGYVQVSRLANPLVNEVLIPLADKDNYCRSSPSADNTRFRKYFEDPEPARLLKALFNVNVPAKPRADMVAIFLTGVDGLNKPPSVTPAELMRLNMTIPAARTPNRLGVIGGDTAGYPNGRRPIDDTVDISLRAVAGVLVSGFNVAPNNVLSDGVDAPSQPFLDRFPFLADPTPGR